MGGKMKKLVVARVGEYLTPTETLTDNGLRTFRALSEKLRDHVAGFGVLLMTSDAPRALACAQIIGSELGVGFEARREFFSDASNPPDLQRAHELIVEREKDVDVVVVVTHYDFIGQFPAHFANKKGFTARSWSVEKASALVLDLESHELIHVRGT
jgi:broad specificity phosphatase PhoE